jgi:hypothetical protein
MRMEEGSGRRAGKVRVIDRKCGHKSRRRSTPPLFTPVHPGKVKRDNSPIWSGISSWIMGTFNTVKRNKKEMITLTMRDVKKMTFLVKHGKE